MGRLLSSAYKIIFLLVFYCLLLALSSPLSYAQNAAEDTSSLKDDNARLQEENAQFKDKISSLEKEVADLDNARKTAEETNRVFSRRLAELHSQQPQPAKKTETSPAKYKYTEKPGGPSKNVEELKETVNALEVERAVYMDKKKALDNQLKEASSDFYTNNEELKRLRTESALMHYNLGVIFQKANKWQEAIREYEKVLETLPDDADTHFNLALIYETVKNDRNKALYHYQKYLETNPSASDAFSVKKRITNINTEKRVWGAPHIGGVPERTGRLW